jgi:hypothetical protein
MYWQPVSTQVSFSSRTCCAAITMKYQHRFSNDTLHHTDAAASWSFVTHVVIAGLKSFQLLLCVYTHAALCVYTQRAQFSVTVLTILEGVNSVHRQNEAERTRLACV